jgi:hypothetical protein
MGPCWKWEIVREACRVKKQARFTHPFHESRITMKRIVQSELLDTLPADDPRAIHSRRDLRRVNAWMRNHAIMARVLQTAVNGHAPKQIIDLGAGDGHFLVRVAKKISPLWPDASVTLLDNQKIVSLQTLSSFTPLGWHAEAVAADVFDWLPTAVGLDVVVANLFLHHFEDTQLVELFRAIAGHARLFVAIEPRRASWPLFCCRLLWAIGCNSVTRHDATVSVRAGFSGHELSVLWPVDNDWQLTERRTGFFSHLFIAQRRD